MDLSTFLLGLFTGYFSRQSSFCREVFADFDPVAVSKLNEKKIIAPGSTANSLLSELKLRAIFENARQIFKVDSHLLMELFRIELYRIHVQRAL